MTIPLPLPLLGCLLALASAGACAQDVPPQITTDSPAYCRQLHERVESLRQTATLAPPREVEDLSAEGLRMCDSGLMRGGVMRLRRALAILMRPEEEQR
jgi:hypothetical protein